MKRFFFGALFSVLMMLSIPLAVSAQTVAGSAAGKKIPNTVAAVKSASPGDYIVLPSGRKYILTREEIAIAEGKFNYDDLSGVKTETLKDGTEIKTISAAHIAYMHPDGQSTHMIKTSVSFNAFLQQHIVPKYQIGKYIDYDKSEHDYHLIEPKYTVFRARIQFLTISNGAETAKNVVVTAYNYYTRNYEQYYFDGPHWQWGNVQGNYKPIGESHELEFDEE